MAKLQASTVPLGLLADLSKQKGKLHKQPDVVFRKRGRGRKATSAMLVCPSRLSLPLVAVWAKHPDGYGF